MEGAENRSFSRLSRFDFSAEGGTVPVCDLDGDTHELVQDVLAGDPARR